ncbi:MAG: hypothetical protein H0W83_01965 [Planctomycetes bacterium]|nr:hypothetical protein [Planctomycetota bacterium]
MIQSRLLLLAMLAATARAGEAVHVAASTSTAVPGDVLTLDNDQIITCTVVPHPKDDGFVVINTGSGMVWIRKERVKTIVLGLDGQMKAIDSTDLPTLLALARWCLVRGYDAQALTVLDRARALPGVKFDLETQGLYATLVDQAANRGPKAALPLYRAYRGEGGSDEKILARLQDLEAAILAHNDELKKLNLPTGFLPESDAAAPDATAVVAEMRPQAANKDGLESKGWDPENAQYSNAAEAKVTQLPPDQGGLRVLALTSPGGAKDKAAIKKSVNYSVDENSVLSFYVQNKGDKPVKIAIAVKTNGQKWIYHESALKVVPPSDGFKEMRFNLKGNDFKSQATNWANNGTVTDLNEVKELQILVYNGTEPASVLLRGMNFIKDSEL